MCIAAPAQRHGAVLRYQRHREKENLLQRAAVFAVILCFVSGRIGALLTENIGIKTVLIPAALLIVAALAMFERREEEKQNKASLFIPKSEQALFYTQIMVCQQKFSCKLFTG